MLFLIFCKNITLTVGSKIGEYYILPFILADIQIAKIRND
jgi:hypothetical protein